MADTLYHLTVTSANGEPTLLKAYQGDVLLIVNVASKCGFTPQYAGLEKLYQTYKGRGLRILAFPCNDFGAQEPGTMEEIQSFCSTNYGVTFDLFQKVHCVGDDKHPLYAWLIKHAESKDEVSWNFEKFLVARDGTLLQRFTSKVTPEDAELISAIEQAL